MQHEENGFVTLTYDDKNCPADGQLRPEDLQGWLKRFRRAVEPRRVRYFAVGEYGDRSGRPHFHLALFGSGCGLGPVRISPGGQRRCECMTCSDVRSSWSFGHTLVGRLEERSAAYIAGYVLKKMNTTSATFSRRPEFARMSLRPGIGAGAVPDVASEVMRWKLEQKGDVPVGLRHGSAVFPLGRYLRNKLRVHCGLPEGCPDEVIEAYRSGLLPVFDVASVLTSAPGMARLHRAVVGDLVEEAGRQEALNASAKEVIYGRRKL